MSNVIFPSTSTIISQSTLKPNQTSLLGIVSASYINGINVYIVNNSAFSSACITLSISTNTPSPITVYSESYTINPQTVLVIQNIYNISNTNVNITLSDNNNVKGYLVYDNTFLTEVPNSTASLPLSQFLTVNTTSPSVSGETEQLTQLEYLFTNQINNLTTQVNSLSSELQSKLALVSTASQYGVTVNNLSSQITSLLNNINSISQQLNQLNNTVNQIPTLQKSIDNNSSTITELSSVVNNYYNTYKETLTETNEALSNIEDTNTNYSSVVSNMTNMSSDINTLQVNQDRIMNILSNVIKIENISDLTI